MKLKLTFLYLIIFSQVFGQQKKIKTSDYSNKLNYIDITFLSEGDFIHNPNKTDKETAFRVIITTSEIYNTLIIEKVTFGNEGGNKKIVSKRKVDLEQFWTEFELNGEIGSIEFSKWLTSDSFELTIQNSTFIFKDISTPIINVTRQ